MAVADGKYSFSSVITRDDNNSELPFKTVPLHKVSSRSDYASFDRLRFVQALIDNLQARTIPKESEGFKIQKSLEILIPELLPDNLKIPWPEGEEQLLMLMHRFLQNCDEAHLLSCFREYCENPSKVPKFLRDSLVFNILHTIPISTAEAERGFSQMNLIISPLRSNLLISHVGSLLFITINGPPPHLWNGTEATTSWLRSHRSAIDSRAKPLKLATVHDMTDVQKLFV